MASLYISYSRRDRAFVDALAQALAARGHSVWNDQQLSPGQDWQEVLSQALRSADALIAVISPDSSASSFVMSEVGAGLAYARDSGRMLVLPLILDEASIPPPLQAVQALDARDRDAAAVAEEIDKAIANFIGSRAAAQEKLERSRERIEHNAADYIEGAVSAQRNAEKRYRILGVVWYSIGLAALIAGLVFVAIALLKTSLTPGDWTAFALIALRAVVVIALLGACAKYAFALGRSFTIESLKCSDRLHAISFGTFYLRAYGDKAEWQDLKEAFADWNIDRASAFANTSASDFDPKLIELVAAVVQGLAPGKKA